MGGEKRAELLTALNKAKTEMRNLKVQKSNRLNRQRMISEEVRRIVAAKNAKEPSGGQDNQVGGHSKKDQTPQKYMQEQRNDRGPVATTTGQDQPKNQPNA